MHWVHRPADADSIARLVHPDGSVNPLLAELLAGRGIGDRRTAEAFLKPQLPQLSDPLALKGMPEAVERLRQAVARKESILIFGDYDVDGVTSTVVLTDFLNEFGLQPRFVVPHRLQEGYGLSLDSLERALAHSKPDLLLAVDCGTSSASETAWLREKGIDVLIIDHHTSKEALPEDCLLINPHVRDPETAPWKHLCSVGLVFKVCHAMVKVLRREKNPIAVNIDIRDYLDLVAMGTVADLVPLTGENRILVKKGLQRLMKCRRPGICTLMEASGINLGATITPFDIGFRLGPRINASGRLEDASLPINLLLSEQWQDCRDMAHALDELNQERQTIERSISDQALARVADEFKDDPGIVLEDTEWHAGVVGIVASRVSRAFNRPTLILGHEGEGMYKGSGRSIEGVDLVEILKSCDDSIQQWGGHPMAVGLTVREDEVASLRTAFKAALTRQFPEGLPEKRLLIDLNLTAEDLTESLLEDLQRLAPFGQGNPEPLFALQRVFVNRITALGTHHFRFHLITGNTPVEGVAWNMAENKPPEGVALDLAVRFSWNEWRGNRSPRLTLIDWKQSA
jgi:single-stranded-DNA-specific exonuclease